MAEIAPPTPTSAAPEMSRAEAAAVGEFLQGVPSDQPAPADVPLPPPVEAPPLAPPPPAEDPLARAREDIARRDRELIEGQAMVRTVLGRVHEYDQLRELARTDPAAALRAIGGDPMLAVQSIVDGPRQLTPQDHINQLSARVEEAVRGQSGLAEQLRQVRESSRMETMIRDSKEALPTLNALMAENPAIVDELVARVRPGTSYGEVLKSAEQNYFGNIMKSLGSLAGTPRFKQELSKMLGGAQQAVPAASQQPPAKTITNSLGGEGRSEQRQLSDAQLRADSRAYLEAWVKGE